jgi:hypothetical protein
MKFEVFTGVKITGSCNIIVSLYPENLGSGALGNRARFKVLTGRDFEGFLDVTPCGVADY